MEKHGLEQVLRVALSTYDNDHKTNGGSSLVQPGNKNNQNVQKASGFY